MTLPPTGITPLTDPIKVLLERWDAKAVEYQTKVESANKQVESLNTRLGELTPPPPDIYNPITLFQQPTIITSITQGLERNKVTAEIATVVEDRNKSDFYTWLYGSIPSSVMGGLVTTVDEALANVVPPANMTQGELADVKEVIEGMINGLTALPQAGESTVLPPGMPPLVKPTGISGLIAPTSIQRLTIDSILKQLAIPDIPDPVLPGPEWEELLTRINPLYADMTQVEIMQAEAERIFADSKLASDMRSGLPAAIADIPKYELGDFLKEMTLSPGLAALQVFTAYNDKVNQPIAGQAYKSSIPELEALYQKHLIAGDSTWEALERSWQEVDFLDWDFPGSGVAEFIFKYMFMETLVDPLFWVSIFTAGIGMVAGRTGHFVKFANTLAKVNKVLQAPGDLASKVIFDPIKWIGTGKWSAKLVNELNLPQKWIGEYVTPKTIVQRAIIAAGMDGNVTKATMETLAGKGKMITRGMTAVDWDAGVKKVLKYSFDNPTINDNITKTGKALLRHDFIDGDDVADLVTKLGAAKMVATPDQLLGVNTVFETMFQKWGSKKAKLLTAKQASKLVLETLQLSGGDGKTLKVAADWLNSRAKGFVDAAYALSVKKAPFEALQKMVTRNYDIHLNVGKAMDAMQVAKSGKFIQLYAGVEAKFAALWNDKVQDIFVRPLSHAYLCTFMFGPKNILEDAWRSTLGGVFPNSMSTNDFAVLVKDLNVDIDLINPKLGASAYLGRVLRHGDPDQFNNWILQAAFLGNKTWASKFSNVLVEMPGGISGDIIRNFVGQKYRVLYNEYGGEALESLTTLAKNAPRIMDKSWAKRVQRSVQDRIGALDVSPDAAKMVKTQFSASAIKENAIDKIALGHPDLPNTIRDSAVESFRDGTLYAKGVASVNENWYNPNAKKLVDEFMKTGEYSTKQMNELTKTLMDMEVTNPEEMAHLLYNVYHVSQAHGKLPAEVLKEAIFSSQGKRLPERRAYMDKIYAEVSTFINDGGDDMVKLVNKMRTDLAAGKSFNPDYTKQSNYFLGLIDDKKKLTSEFLVKDMAWRHELFAGVNAKDMTDDWWQGVAYPQMRSRINLYQAQMADLEGNILSAAHDVDLAAGINTIRPAVSVVGRPLAPQDIANLIGCHGDDFSKAMLSTMTVMNNREMFVAYVMSAAKRNGSVGFTKDSVGKVFDQIARQARLEPDLISWLSKPQMELESMRAELQQAYLAKMLPDDDVKEIARYVDDVFGRANEMVYGPDVRVQKIPDFDVGLGERMLTEAEIADVNIPFEFKSGSAVPVLTDTNYINKIRAELTEAAEKVKAKIPDNSHLSGAREDFTLKDMVDTWFTTSDNEALQVIGNTASSTPEYLAKVRAILKEKYPSGYIRIYRGSGAAAAHGNEALGREFTNVTSSRATSLEFEDTWKQFLPTHEELMKGTIDAADLAVKRAKAMAKPSIDNILIRVNDVVAIGSVDESELIIKSSILKRHIDVPLKAPVKILPKIMKPEFTNLLPLRQKAIDDAMVWRYKEFTDYTNGNAFDSFMKGVDPFWCVPVDHEILTREGWKYQSELSIGDEVLCLDIESESSRWDKLESVTVFDYDGELYDISHKMADFQFVPNHRFPVWTQHSKHLELLEAYKLDTNCCIPRVAPFQNQIPQEESILDSRLSAILGWTITDGHTQGNGSIRISQSCKKYLMDIEKLCGNKGKYVNGFVYRVSVGLDDRLAIQRVYKKPSDLYHIITNLSPMAMESMWDAMAKAEGWTDGHRIRFFQKDKTISSVFQMLSIMLGKAISIGTQMSGYGKTMIDKVNVWSNTGNLYFRGVKSKYYKGQVWCPVTPTGTWLMRHNGHVIWTGNTYQSQRWYWLPRSFVKYPGFFMAHERWVSNTDEGYIQIPGTSIQANPFSGSVYGPMSNTTIREYPTYYDAWEGAEPTGKFFDWLSRWGFYLGPQFTVPMALFGGIEAQTGEALPPIWTTPFMIAQAVSPDSKFIQTLTDHVFPSRFRDYMTTQEAISRGADGVVLSAKLQNKQPLTDEEQAVWNDSRRSVAGYSLMFEMFGGFRLRPEERAVIKDAVAGYIAEKYPQFTVERQEWYERHGYRLWDQVGGMSPDDQRIIEEMQGFKYTGTANRLLPGVQQLIVDQLTLAWDRVGKSSDSSDMWSAQIERDFKMGIIGPDEYGKKLQSLQSKLSILIYDESKALMDAPLPTGLTPEKEKEFVKEHSYMSLEGRKRYLEKYNNALPVLHPLKELVNLYYSVELNEAIDPDTGQPMTDWATFWAQKQAIEDAVPDMWKREFSDTIHKGESRLESIRRQVQQTYFNKYYDIYNQVLKGYSDDERVLIKEYLDLEKRQVNFPRQAEILSMVSEKSGGSLVSGFRSNVSKAKVALRYANPTLDAWLFYWGKVSSFQTPQAEQAYQRIVHETGRKS